MFKFNASFLLCFLVLSQASFAQSPTTKPATYAGIGRTATTAEVKAWDIDVRPDFLGLPKGSGSVLKGQDIWESKCASCHGYFGESNQFFNPIIGGVAAKDLQTGHVASLRDMNYPQRTTMMKLSSLSTLWDYINRAMPWNNPKTLTTEEVYAVTAYILNLSAVVPEDFILSDANIAQVQAKIPNRNGKTTNHALWPDEKTLPVKTQPDINSGRCLTDCLSTAPKVVSVIPDYARDAHGNLADQSRLVGPQRGAITVKTGAGADAGGPIGANPPVQLMPPSTETTALLNKYTCNACHGMESKLVGPSFSDISVKYTNQLAAGNYLSSKIRQGGVGVWGNIPMPAQTLTEAESVTIALWLINQTLTPAPTGPSTSQLGRNLGRNLGSGSAPGSK
jgi:S-disulfanyl-L-cysteine oxidoreductase SoxD